MDEGRAASCWWCSVGGADGICGVAGERPILCHNLAALPNDVITRARACRAQIVDNGELPWARLLSRTFWLHSH